MRTAFDLPQAGQSPNTVAHSGPIVISLTGLSPLTASVGAELTCLNASTCRVSVDKSPAESRLGLLHSGETSGVDDA